MITAENIPFPSPDTLWDNAFAWAILPKLLRGLLVTIEATLLGMLIALTIGLVIAVIRRTGIPVISPFFGFIVYFIRGTPLLVQLYLVFFGLPSVGIAFAPLTTGILVLGINYTAYTAEVYRAGVEDVPKGQWEAATALSMSMPLTWIRIVLPQAVRDVVPMLGNYLVQMFKDSALLFTILVMELMGEVTEIRNTYNHGTEPILMAGAMYLIISLVASLLIRGLESRLALQR
jgi:polar amino acid transport system permease protein